MRRYLYYQERLCLNNLMYPQNQQQDLMAKLMANKKMLALVGGIVLVLLFLVPILLAGSKNPTPSRVVTLQSHFTALADFTNEQEDRLIDGGLRRQNATIGILLAGAANDIKTISAQVYGPIEPSPATVAANAARLAEMQAALDASVATNTYDETYKLIVASELQTLDALLAEYASQSSQTVAEVLQNIRERLAKGRELLSNYEL